MSNQVVQFILVTTTILLFASMWTIYRIRSILQHEPIRVAWTFLASTLLLASVGCLVFLRTNDMEGDSHHEDWLVALTLLSAAIFVFGVCAVSLFTATDLARINDLEKAAFFDPLTSLYTRGHIDALLALQCMRSRTETSQLSVILLDIDDFKFVNDCFGHQAGDYVLREVARILTQSVDPAHLIGRYGGEEFLIVAPEASPVLAMETAERIRSSIAAAHLAFEGNDIAVTVSLGVKTIFTFREDAKELVVSADTAMYEAKRRGRNRVVVAEGPSSDSFAESLNGISVYSGQQIQSGSK